MKSTHIQDAEVPCVDNHIYWCLKTVLTSCWCKSQLLPHSLTRTKTRPLRVELPGRNSSIVTLRWRISSCLWIQQCSATSLYLPLLGNHPTFAAIPHKRNLPHMFLQIYTWINCRVQHERKSLCLLPYSSNPNISSLIDSICQLW